MKIINLTLLLLLLVGATSAAPSNFNFQLNPVVDLNAQINLAPPEMTHLYEQIHSNYVNLIWDTLPQTNASLVVFRNNPNPAAPPQIVDFRANNATFAINHSVRVTGLSPGVNYWYSIVYCAQNGWCNATLRNFVTTEPNANPRAAVQINQASIKINGTLINVSQAQQALDIYVNTCTPKLSQDTCKVGFLVKPNGAQLQVEQIRSMMDKLNYSWLEGTILNAQGRPVPVSGACTEAAMYYVIYGGLAGIDQSVLDAIHQNCLYENGLVKADGSYCLYAVTNTSVCQQPAINQNPGGLNAQGANAAGNAQGGSGSSSSGGSGSSSGSSSNGGAVAPAAPAAQGPANVSINVNVQPDVSKPNNASNANARQNATTLINSAPIVPGVDNSIVIAATAALVIILIAGYVFLTKKK